MKFVQDLGRFQGVSIVPAEITQVFSVALGITSLMGEQYLITQLEKEALQIAHCIAFKFQFICVYGERTSEVKE